MEDHRSRMEGREATAPTQPMKDGTRKWNRRMGASFSRQPIDRLHAFLTADCPFLSAF
jgi:hypothetical protein